MCQVKEGKISSGITVSLRKTEGDKEEIKNNFHP